MTFEGSMQRIHEIQAAIVSLGGDEAAAELLEVVLLTLACLKDRAAFRPKAVVMGSVTLHLDLEVECNSVTITVSICSKRPEPVSGSTFLWSVDYSSLNLKSPQKLHPSPPLPELVDFVRAFARAIARADHAQTLCPGSIPDAHRNLRTLQHRPSARPVDR
jgi:hypothetical protein